MKPKMNRSKTKQSTRGRWVQETARTNMTRAIAFPTRGSLFEKTVAQFGVGREA